MAKWSYQKIGLTIWERIEIKALQNFISIFPELDQVEIELETNNRVLKESIWRKIKSFAKKSRAYSKDIKPWKISQGLWKSTCSIQKPFHSTKINPISWFS
jgi:hypothetical protein